jgi:DNA-binding response OmpR family regulator
MNILLVEDDQALRKTAAAALKLCGHNTVCAADGVEALAFARDSRPDLVVLDLHMPDMDGWEFLERFRSQLGYADIPVVVMSAAHRVKVHELDVQAFFTKPFDLDEFIDAVEQLLSVPTNQGRLHAEPRNERAYAEE